MPKTLRVLATLGGAAVSLMLMAGPASAGSVTSPSSNPYTVAGDATGTPQSFTISGTGFPVGSTVYVEQCDGVASTTSGWSPTDHCDLGTSPAGKIADASGNVTFTAKDPNFGFVPFKGLSPQGIFSCGASSDTDPGDGYPFFKNCQIRLSTSNGAVTSDQTLFTINLPNAETPPPSTPEAPYALLLPLGGVAAAAGFLTIRNRRASHSAAA
ncbi:hypothetical protein [Aquihabitans sp. McL0605]|uniref:hypothetical protein n=1 Tax=Aquihabitans sp. McL0605 TaxID=3415671 RepID=UPI003CF916E9